MRRQDAGRWVSRVGATGGGRSYRRQMPLRWYGSLVVIVLLGVTLIVYSRYERQHPAPAAQPTTSAHWFVGVSFDLCGKTDLLAANNTLTGKGLYSEGNGIVVVAPTGAANAGANATLGKFASSYPKLVLTGDSIRFPKMATLTNGRACPKGTPDAGKTGELQARVFLPSAVSNPPQQGGDLRTIHFDANLEKIVVGFVPSGTVLELDTAVSTAVSEAYSSYLTSLESTTTTLPTTLPSTSTTVKGSTSTTKPGTSTSTTKPGTSSTTTATTGSTTSTTTKTSGSSSTTSTT